MKSSKIRMVAPRSETIIHDVGGGGLKWMVVVGNAMTVERKDYFWFLIRSALFFFDSQISDLTINQFSKNLRQSIYIFKFRKWLRRVTR
ncbi:hypothetical protein L2E82_20236 [Cichorium intybus]|uniref:Uncharacterized protein n=1 Tax=Cichorium intybus TaxID=13427 RepID=A0ACB9DTJ8_CICIN|nr:hypothetical protein L2E82_20236 [Cichorium intybus]